MLTTEDLDKRLLQIEDHQALIDLKHRYCLFCDDNYNAQAIASLFAVDAIWDGGILGRAHTRAGIQRYFEASAKKVRLAIHHVTNPLIEISGHTALCHWYLWQPMVFRTADRAFWYAASYTDRCIKEAGQWKFAAVEIKTRLMSPYEQGFGAAPIVELNI